MEVYRITREKYAADLTGEGARLYGGRWNRPGVAALYTSEARSLALLELLVHFNSAAALKMKYVFITLTLNEKDVETLDRKYFKKGSTNFNDESLWQLTDDFFINKNILALRVPSVIIPQEYNIIINPAHSKMKHIEIIQKENADIDMRLVSNI
ncbi:MAG: RES family NAD+ phosphorylase [Saprospiraceae bacterium]|nr:RES family NAD+ phosphorylase [Saprospiraceae bacterium]